MTVDYRLNSKTLDKLADLPVAPGFRAGIFLAAAGSLTFTLDDFLQRRSRFLAGFGVSGLLYGSHQVHSRNVVEIDTASPEDVSGVEADAMVTHRRDAVLTYIVADCLSIFIADTETTAFSLVHSGWRGTGIVTKVILRMVSLYGSRARDICAFIGPGIGACCYHVPTERGHYFENNFGADTVDWDTPNAPRVDLRTANVNLLERLCVQKVTVTGDCTCCSPNLGSFRRDGEQHTRMLTFICRSPAEEDAARHKMKDVSAVVEHRSQR